MANPSGPRKRCKASGSESLKHTDLAVNVPIRLQVGERHFTTAKETLTEESGFFASLLSGRWDNALEDGSYFIDADPVLFDHILRYLHRGVFPLSFDIDKGHDYHFYLSLLEEARYFQIPRLVDWLEKKCYLEAAHVTITPEVHDEKTPRWVVDAGTTLEFRGPHGTREVYCCDHSNWPYDEGPCDECKKEGEPDTYFLTLQTILVMKRAVTFKPEVCLARDN